LNFSVFEVGQALKIVIWKIKQAIPEPLMAFWGCAVDNKDALKFLPLARIV